jgi:fluoride exporter
VTRRTPFRDRPFNLAKGELISYAKSLDCGRQPLGGMARYWCTGFAARMLGETFPWGTLLVNITGSLIIGFFATLTGPDGRIFASSTVRQFVMIGLCGGYTTFSSFSLQTLNLANDGEWLQAGGNIIGSVVLCLLAVWLGHILAVSINAMRWI